MMRNGRRAHRPTGAAFTRDCVHHLGAGFEDVIFSAALGVCQNRAPRSDNLFSINQAADE